MARLSGLPKRLNALPRRVAPMPKKAEGFYQSQAWRDYRSRHADWTRRQRGGLWCCQCGGTRRLTLDHRVERRDGGADFPPFEEADWYCAGCHARKTATARAARARGER